MSSKLSEEEITALYHAPVADTTGRKAVTYYSGSIPVITVMPDAMAWVRVGKVFKQLAVYNRDGSYYVPHGSGFVRICRDRFDGRWPTTHPDVVVYELAGVVL